ncbi:MAG: hypothetical protein M5U19_08830 [Microthrixaceae bacterium]|nr:hypothetical protein [Microthrixaceae bacterium]
MQYIVDKYGCCPAYINPVREVLRPGPPRGCRLLPPLHRRRRHPYSLTPQINSHFADWHVGQPDPNGGVT